MTKNRKKRIRWGFFIFFTPVFLWLFLLLVLPQLELIRLSFVGSGQKDGAGFTFKNYLAFFHEPIYWLTFVRTAIYSILVTFLVMSIALPVAFYITKIARIKASGFLMVLLLVPFWVSELIRVYGWMILLRESGVINRLLVAVGMFKQPIELLYNDVTMIMGLVYTSMLFMVIPIIGVMESLDDSLIEAAYDLGAKKIAIWRTIIIPYCMSGIISGGIIVFMLVLGSYLTPNLMGGKNSLWFTEQIYNQIILYFNWNQGAAFGFLLLAAFVPDHMGLSQGIGTGSEEGDQMIRSLPRSKTYITGFRVFIALYFSFLFAPLIVTMILAFNDSMFPSLPWEGFTLDWFFGNGPKKYGIFNDQNNLRSIVTSFKVALAVTTLSTIVGTFAAFLFEQEDFKFKGVLYFLMIAPLVIPGVILGISILLFANSMGTFLENIFHVYIKALSPGFWLVVFGQFSFITTIVTLVVIARLRKFDRSLEEAAYNLGANRFEVLWFITLRYLRPAIVGGAAIAFLMSFENFNTTVFLIGSQATLPINLYLQVRDGSTPVINAISFLLIVGTSIFAVANLYTSGKKAR